MSVRDNVIELRKIHHADKLVERIIRSAADEIERLREESERLRAERDEVRQSYCSLMEAYRGGDGRVTANKLGWGYLFEEDTNG